MGKLAENNARGMSEEAKDVTWKKHHDYLFQDHPLPKGMKRIGNVKERVASIKQVKKDKRKVNK